MREYEDLEEWNGEFLITGPEVEAYPYEDEYDDWDGEPERPRVYHFVYVSKVGEVRYEVMEAAYATLDFREGKAAHWWPGEERDLKIARAALGVVRPELLLILAPPSKPGRRGKRIP